MSTGTRYTGLIEHYRDRLPVSAETRVISLGEGNTPLVRLENIPRETGRDVELYIKYEGLNPTGSFKDRGMTMAVTKAVDDPARVVAESQLVITATPAKEPVLRAGQSVAYLEVAHGEQAVFDCFALHPVHAPTPRLAAISSAV